MNRDRDRSTEKERERKITDASFKRGKTKPATRNGDFPRRQFSSIVRQAFFCIVPALASAYTSPFYLNEINSRITKLVVATRGRNLWVAHSSNGSIMGMAI